MTVFVANVERWICVCQLQVMLMRRFPIYLVHEAFLIGGPTRMTPVGKAMLAYLVKLRVQGWALTMQPGSSPRNLPEVFADQHCAEWDFLMAHSFHWRALTKATFTEKGMRGCSSIQQRLRNIHSSAVPVFAVVSVLTSMPSPTVAWWCLEAPRANSSACAVLDDAAPA